MLFVSWDRVRGGAGVGEEHRGGRRGEAMGAGGRMVTR